MLFGGNGNGKPDVNECNDLDIALENIGRAARQRVGETSGGAPVQVNPLGHAALLVVERE